MDESGLLCILCGEQQWSVLLVPCGHVVCNNPTCLPRAQAKVSLFPCLFLRSYTRRRRSCVAIYLVTLFPPCLYPIQRQRRKPCPICHQTVRLQQPLDFQFGVEGLC